MEINANLPGKKLVNKRPYTWKNISEFTDFLHQVQALVQLIVLNNFIQWFNFLLFAIFYHVIFLFKKNI